MAEGIGKMMPPIATLVTLILIPTGKLNVGDTYYLISLFTLLNTPLMTLMFALMTLVSGKASSERLGKAYC
jgi:ABC-type multidrug transport system fused ATPase/permease subunit